MPKDEGHSSHSKLQEKHGTEEINVVEEFQKNAPQEKAETAQAVGIVYQNTIPYDKVWCFKITTKNRVLSLLCFSFYHGTLTWKKIWRKRKKLHTGMDI